MGAIKTFKTTNWVLVSKASSSSEDERLEALGDLFHDYAPALTEFLERFYRLSPDQAENHVQDFISDRLLAGNLLRQAKAKRGRFRTFLLTAIRSYLTDRLRSANSLKRRPPNGFVHLEESETATLKVPDKEQEESVFNEVFARQLIAESIRRTHLYCQQTDQTDAWEILFARILGPLFEDLPKVDYPTLVRELELPSVALAQRKLTTVKRIFRRQFREVVSDYTASDLEAEEEIEYLKEFLCENLHNFED